MTTCTVSKSVSLQDILAATPRGQVAMFRVMTITGQVSDWVCGQMVYVSRNGNVLDFMTNQVQGPVSEFGLHFVSYINRS